ncbi:MAG: squalene/phytoene synthase family protein [Proteobacteria bacterium]|nr:squalene/phytoene synthase family protein [Pseudomonadota bacterium]MBS0573670.1 squalene/phytoene synthase family protein [Pseudomonadota bacterium]
MAAPPAARGLLWPLYALNLELARAPYASAEPMIAEMRLQWWTDQIESLGAGRAGEGKVAAALAPVIAAAPGIVPLLAGMAEARRWEAWREPFASRAAFDTYHDRTAGNLMWAAALALGAPPGAEAPVRDFAQAAGLAGWLAAVPALLGHGRQPLPDPRPAAIAGLAGEGLALIARARAGRGPVPPAARPALWTGWAARFHLRAALRAPETVVTGLPAPSHLRRSLALSLRSATPWW